MADLLRLTLAGGLAWGVGFLIGRFRLVRDEWAGAAVMVIALVIYFIVRRVVL